MWWVLLTWLWLCACLGQIVQGVFQCSFRVSLGKLLFIGKGAISAFAVAEEL